MDAIINEFLVESYENLDKLDQDLVDLEKDPTEQSLLASIFRTIHTIKGTCGFIGFSKLESIAHVGENLLSKLRDGELTLNPAITSALLAMVDGVRQILSCIENEKNEGDVDYSQLISTLTCLQKGESVEVAAAPSSPELAPKAPERESPPAGEEKEEASLFEKIGGRVAVQAAVDIFYSKVLKDSRIKDFFEGVDMRRLKKKQQDFLTFAFGGIQKYDGKSMREAHKHLVEKGMNHSHFDAVIENLAATLKDMEVSEDLSQEVIKIAISTKADILHGCEDSGETSVGESGTENQAMAVAESGDSLQEIQGGKIQEERREEVDRRQENRGISEASIRVDVNLLDRLMNLVGELVLARNQILQFAPTAQDSTFTATTQHLNLVTTELQEGVMKTRMQPIGNIWNKFPRVVRDLALSCGKKVRLEMEGKDTELDKTLIEAIKDPLTHIVRNSVDHGIEMPEVRKAAGKPEEGILKLRAFHEGGQVNVEIVDDGGGIDPQKIRQKALEKHIITQDQAAKMNDREVVNLIFAAGFSTAAKVTNVSGRGVGMDVVKTNIERIGGTVDIQSRPGKGTTLKVKIPLTLAIIPALTVRTGGARYAIPQVNLLELVRLEGEQVKKSVEQIQGAPVYRLRGNLLPLIYLHEELRVAKKEESDAVNIVVLQADERQFGLVVEGINDTEEIVVKPLGKQLKGIPAFAGATIMGDGKVALILDVMGLAHSARVVSESRERVLAESIAENQKSRGDKQTLLIFGVGENGRLAIPLSQVARLEEFQRSSIEHSGDCDVVQYRGEIMPLIYLSQVLNGVTPPRSENMQAVVYTYNGRSVALVADRIIDIVEEMITVKRNSRRKGTLGTVVVQNRVTDLLDAEGIVRENDPSFIDEPSAVPIAIGS
ncbi:MAG: chemotaxis protein CheW [Nitrospinaceae bacterium]